MDRCRVMHALMGDAKKKMTEGFGGRRGLVPISVKSVQMVERERREASS